MLCIPDTVFAQSGNLIACAWKYVRLQYRTISSHQSTCVVSTSLLLPVIDCAYDRRARSPYSSTLDMTQTSVSRSPCFKVQTSFDFPVRPPARPFWCFYFRSRGLLTSLTSNVAVADSSLLSGEYPRLSCVEAFAGLAEIDWRFLQVWWLWVVAVEGLLLNELETKNVCGRWVNAGSFGMVS